MSGQPAHARTQPPDHEPIGDAQLIANLRGGDLDAYEELWERHIGPALRLAHRLSPHQPEDLAAEAFTTVLHQITVAGGGPDRNFRAYVFTVMRNLAIRWNQESRRALPLTVLEDPVAEEVPDRIIGDEDSRIVLQAFRTLPARWQQVLWLAEVEDEPRPAIAVRLKMSPNSVSALLRRARQGLRYRCLIEHVPEALREDRSHVARVLPDLVMGKLTPDTVVKVTGHLTRCDACREVNRELRSLSWRVKHATLGTLGFGALIMFVKDLGAAGIAAAATTTLAAGTAAGGLAFGIPLSTAIKVAAIAVGVAAVMVPVAGGPFWLSGPPEEAAAALPPEHSPTPRPTIDEPAIEPPTPQKTGEPVSAPPTSEASTHPDDIQVIDLWHPTTSAPTPSRPRHTPVAPGSIPGPAAQPDVDETTTPTPEPSPSASSSTPPATDASSSVPESSPPVPVTSPSASPPVPIQLRIPAAPVVTASGTASGYLAPLLSGTGEPLATVAARLVHTSPDDATESTATYTVTADSTGTWSLDLSDLDLIAADYRATVWQIVGSVSSPATTVDFTVTPLQVDGLEPVMGLRTTDAATTGIVITIVAPGQQTACLRSNFGQETRIPLAADGTATRRLRFVGVEIFELEVSVCEGDRRGAATRATVIVYAFWGDPGSAAEPGIIVEEP